MKRYVVTGFDEHYWNAWGMHWLASLQNVAHYKGDIIVVGHNLSEITQEKLKKANVLVIPSSANNDFRKNTLLKISQFSQQEDAIFAYWDADSYFQENIDSIFDLAKDNFVVATNVNLGFIAGPSNRWQIFEEVDSLMSFMNDSRDLFTCILNFYAKFFSWVDDSWNFTDVTNLIEQNGKLTFKGNPQKVIHPSGIIKTMLENKNILFQERYEEFSSLFKKKNLKFISRRE